MRPEGCFQQLETSVNGWNNIPMYLLPAVSAPASRVLPAGVRRSSRFARTPSFLGRPSAARESSDHERGHETVVFQCQKLMYLLFCYRKFVGAVFCKIESCWSHISSKSCKKRWSSEWEGCLEFVEGLQTPRFCFPFLLLFTGRYPCLIVRAWQYWQYFDSTVRFTVEIAFFRLFERLFCLTCQNM